MFALTTTNVFYLYCHPADMRKSFDSLCGIVQNELQRNPSSGDVFIFLNKPRNRIKLLHWERGGYLLYYKRLESGTFEMPEFDTHTNEYCIPWHQLVMMVEGILGRNIKFKKRYFSINSILLITSSVYVDSEGCKVDICVMNNTQGNIKMPFNEESFLRLQGMYSVVRDENVQLTADVLYYKNEIAQLKRMIFGAKSERFNSGEDSSHLLLGLNLTGPMAEPVKTETITYKRKQKEENKQLIHSRQPLPLHLPRHEIVI